jgi:hypothetical protein
MGFFGKPDIEKMRRDGDIAGLVHWADFRRDRDLSRAAVTALRQNVYGVVEHLYETAAWAQAHGGRRSLSPRGVYLLRETATALTKIGARAVTPLADSVRVYDSYGDPDADVRYLYLVVACEVLERIGRPARDELRALAKSPDRDVRTLAKGALASLERRGLLDDRDEDLED